MCGFIAFTESIPNEDTQQPHILLSTFITSRTSHRWLRAWGCPWNSVCVMKSKTWFLMIILIFTTTPPFNLAHEYPYANDILWFICEWKETPLSTILGHHGATRDYFLIKKQWSEEKKCFPRIAHVLRQSLIKEANLIGAVENKRL